MIKPARPRDPASLPGEQSARDGVCLDMRASARTTQGVLGASELVDAPRLDRWPETDRAIPMRRPLDSPPKR